jgi:hypothetical protein
VGHQDVSKFEGIQLRPEDIIVGFHTLNWGMKNKNPMDQILFFNSESNLGKLRPCDLKLIGTYH